VENHGADVLSLRAGLVKCVKAHTCLIVPDFDDAFVVTGNEVRLLLISAEVYAIDADLVATEGVVSGSFLGSHSPNLD